MSNPSPQEPSSERVPKRDSGTGSSLTPVWLVSHKALSLKRSPQDWQRALFYLVGGVIGISFLLIFARQINPPDAALQNRDMAKVLGNWDGSWRGHEERFSSNGRHLASHPVTHDYHSSAWNLQTVTIARESVVPSIQSWVNRVDQDGAITAYNSLDGDEPEQLYQGSYVDGVILWTRETSSGRHLIRTWIAINTLHYEETFFSRSHPDEGYIISARLKRD